jgi:hypothetical protein
MKTALIRVLAIATLATSMSAFAATEEPKHDNTATTAQQQDGCPESAGHAKKQKNAKPRRANERTEQEKEFDRLLMGMYG